MRRYLKPVTFLLCLLPLAWLLARGFGVAGTSLGANPIDELQDKTGEWALRLLLVTLCITPLAVTLRKPWLLAVRRMLGLFSFSYLCLHFVNWLVLDQWLDLRAVLADIANEERVHAGEFLRLLYELDPKEKEFYKEGAGEVEELLEKLPGKGKE